MSRFWTAFVTTRISDEDRKHLEEALAAALLLLYVQVATEQYDQLGADDSEPSDEAKQKIAAMAAETALLMQQGINQRLSDAGDNAEQVQGEIKDYNESVLLPFLTSWATHQAISDVYDAVPNPDNPDQSMKDAVQWVFQQNTSFLDDCTAAEEASPDTFDNLVAIAGGSPPVHRNCQCTLTPVTG